MELASLGLKYKAPVVSAGQMDINVSFRNSQSTSFSMLVLVQQEGVGSTLNMMKQYLPSVEKSVDTMRKPKSANVRALQ